MFNMEKRYRNKIIIIIIIITCHAYAQCWHASRHLWADLVQTWYDDAYTELYILILVNVTMAKNQGDRNARKQHILCRFSEKFAMDLDGIWYVVETCLSDESQTHVISLYYVL